MKRAPHRQLRFAVWREYNTSCPLPAGVQGRFNFVNLSRYGWLHESTFRRVFAKEFDWLEFNHRLLTAIIPPYSQLIAVMDASFIPKSGKHTPGVNWFFHGYGLAPRELRQAIRNGSTPLIPLLTKQA